MTSAPREVRVIGLPTLADAFDRLLKVYETCATPVSSEGRAKLDFKSLFKRDEIDRKQQLSIIKAAHFTFEQLYVHLLQKYAYHATAPLEALNKLKRNVQSDEGVNELLFHREMLSIFTNVHDLHTNYSLPEPFNHIGLFMPFYVQKCYTSDLKAIYIVNKIVPADIPAGERETFVVGVEILKWNFVPIDIAVEANASRNGGSNIHAQLARGLQSLTQRSLASNLLPDEDEVLVEYIPLKKSEKDEQPKSRECRFRWVLHELTPLGAVRVGPLPNLHVFQNVQNLVDAAQQSTAFSASSSAGSSAGSSAANASEELPMYLAMDVEGERLRLAEAEIFGHGSRNTQKSVQGQQLTRAEYTRLLETAFFRMVPGKKIGYLRLKTFSYTLDDPHDRHAPGILLSYFMNLVEQHKADITDGLIVDIRGNGGGYVIVSDLFLQYLRSKALVGQKVRQAQFQFRITPAIEELINNKDGGYAQFLPAFPISLKVGAGYTTVHPLTSDETMLKFQQHVPVKKILLVDAESYSASDMFACGWKDNKHGKTISTDGSTGAGGAFVLDYKGLKETFPSHSGWVPKEERGEHYQKPQNSGDLPDLPHGTDFRVALGRTLRGGVLDHIPIEDVGLYDADVRHYMTKDDVLKDNVDLIAKAVDVLQGYSW